MMTYWRLRVLKPDLRGVNGDVLVALGLEGVHEVGPFKGHAAPLGRLSAIAPSCPSGSEPVSCNKPADKGGFAMVHVADDDNFAVVRWERSISS